MTGRAVSEARPHHFGRFGARDRGGIDPVMALSDYMPYGAPELLDGASPRMARATFLASGLVAAMVCCAGLIASSRPAVVEVPLGPARKYYLEPEVRTKEPAGSGPVLVKVTKAPSIYHPVLNAPPLAPPIDEPPVAGPESSSHTGEPEAADGGGSVPVQDVDPPPGVFVYTDELPQLVRAVKPVYPDLAHEAGVEGTVKVQMLVGLDGHVLRAIVAPRGSVPMLDEAALAAALQSVFTPALVNGRPVKVWVTQDYRFTLH